MSKVLYYNEARQHTLSAGPKNLIRLVPGRNVIDDKDYEAVLGCGTRAKPSRLSIMIEEGIVKVAGDSVDITKLNVNKALELVEMEATEEGLKDLLLQENSSNKTRKTVVKAIDQRMDEIENAENEGDNDDENQKD